MVQASDPPAGQVSKKRLPNLAPPRRATLIRLWTGLATGLLVAVLVGGIVTGWMLRGALVADSVEPPSPTSSSAPATVTVSMPDLRGLTEQDAMQVIADAGMDPNQVSVQKVPYVGRAGTVVSQDPVARAADPAKVVLFVPELAKMPDLQSKTLAEAMSTLVTMGARPSVSRQYSPTIAPGSVISSTPTAGEELIAEPTLIVSGATATISLSSIRSVGDCSSTSNRTVNGIKVGNGISCSTGRIPGEEAWIIARAAGRLQGVLGIDDQAKPGTTAHIRLTADDRTIVDQDLAYGQSVNVDADVSGALRLQLTVTTNDPGYPKVIFGNAALLGAADALATIDGS